MSNKRKLYVKIVVFFSIFVIYSFCLLAFSLKNIMRYEKEYEYFAKNHIQQRLTQHMEEIEDSLKAFSIASYSNISSIDQFKTMPEKVERGLNLYNNIFEIEGKVYMLLKNGEIYCSDNTEYYFQKVDEDNNEVANTKEAVKDLISSSEINTDQSMKCLYSPKDNQVFYFLYPIYDSKKIFEGYVIKECDMIKNRWIMTEVLEAYDIKEMRIIDADENIRFSTYLNRSFLDKMKIRSVINDIKVTIPYIDTTLEMRFPVERVFNKYLIGAYITVGIILAILILCTISFFSKNPIKEYKILMILTLVAALLIGNTIRRAYLDNCISICEEMATRIKDEDILDDDDINGKMERGLRYIKNRLEYMYSFGYDTDAILQDKEQIIGLARRTQRYISTYATGFYYTSDGRLYSSENFVRKKCTEQEQEHFDTLLNMEEDYYATTFVDEYGKSIRRMITRVDDKDGNLLLILGLDFDYKNYNRRVQLIKHMHDINNDATLYHVEKDFSIAKIIIKDHQKEVYYENLNKKMIEVDDIYADAIRKIYKSGKVTGHFTTGSLKNKKHNFFIQSMYGENYLVVTMDNTEVTNMRVLVTAYETFIMCLYVLFTITLLERKLMLSRKYTIKEHELHSNY